MNTNGSLFRVQGPIRGEGWRLSRVQVSMQRGWQIGVYCHPGGVLRACPGSPLAGPCQTTVATGALRPLDGTYDLAWIHGIELS